MIARATEVDAEMWPTLLIETKNKPMKG